MLPSHCLHRSVRSARMSISNQHVDHSITSIHPQYTRAYTSNFDRSEKLRHEQRANNKYHKQPTIIKKKWLDRDPKTDEVVLPTFISSRHDADPDTLEALMAFITKHRKKSLSIRSTTLHRKIDTLRSKYWRQLTKGHADVLIEACVAAKAPKFALRLLQRFWPVPDTHYVELDGSNNQTTNQSTNQSSDAHWPDRWVKALKAITENPDHTFPAQQLLDEFVSYIAAHNMRLNPSSVVSIMQCLSNQKRWNDIIALSDRCRTEGPPLSLYAYPEVMQAYQHIKQWEPAFALLAEALEQPHIKSSPKSIAIYHACITTLGVCHQPQLALDIFHTMKQQQLPLNATTYAATINALAEPDDPNQSSPSPFTYANIFALYEEVVLAEMKFVTPLYFALIRGCLRFNQPRFAISFFEEMLQFALENDEGGAWQRVGTFANEPRIWQFLAQIGVTADDPQTIPTLTARLCEAYRLGRSTMTAAQRENAPTFLSVYYVNDMLQYLIKVQRPDLIDWVWRHMASIDVQDNHVSLYYRVLAELMRVEANPERMDTIVELLCLAFHMIKLHDKATIQLITGDWRAIADKRSFDTSLDLYCLMASYEPILKAKLNDPELVLPTKNLPFKIKVNDEMKQHALSYLSRFGLTIPAHNMILKPAQIDHIAQTILSKLKAEQFTPVAIPSKLIKQWTGGMEDEEL